MIEKNSSGLISPSPSVSARSIISNSSASENKKYNIFKATQHMHIFLNGSCRYSPLIVSPSSFATRLRFLNEIFPVWSSSKRLKTFWMSSRVSLSL
eukprot:gene6943-gene7667